jgi:hypothetical protein
MVSPQIIDVLPHGRVDEALSTHLRIHANREDGLKRIKGMTYPPKPPSLFLELLEFSGREFESMDL